MAEFEYSLRVIQAIDTLKEELRSIAKRNTDLIEEVPKPDVKIAFQYVAKPSLFYFKVIVVYQQGGSILVRWVGAPYNMDTPGAKPGVHAVGSVPAVFTRWVQNIRQYAVSPTFQELVTPKADAFYRELKLTDPVADQEPFNEEERRQLNLYLVSLEEKLLDEGIQDEQLSREIYRAKTISWHAPKNAVLRQIARIWSLLTNVGSLVAIWAVEQFFEYVFVKSLDTLVEHGPAVTQLIQTYIDQR